MKLNCDLGEDFGQWKMSVDDEIFRYIDQANVACGFHAGDPVTIEQTLKQAINHKLEIGAHPSYPDLVGFGRRHMAMSHDELVASLRYQIAALQGLTSIAGGSLSYVKPHGALYNDLTSDAKIRKATMAAVSAFPNVRLMIQHTPEWTLYEQEAELNGLTLIAEAFIDRLYAPDGRLVSRRIPGAVLDEKKALDQATRLIDNQNVVTSEGTHLRIEAQSLCVHGDNPQAIQLSKSIKALLIAC